jgi:GTP:adenosylcobinamide-phosphate guanylyltransferase
MGKSKLIGIVLCGGASKRFGEDKALAEFNGRPMIDLAIEQLTPHCDHIVLLAGRRPHRFWSRLKPHIEVSSDPGEGPAEALRYWFCEHKNRALVIAVDMPKLTAAALGRYLDGAPTGCSILGDPALLKTQAKSLSACLREVHAVRISPQAVQIDDQQLVNVNRPMSQQE